MSVSITDDRVRRHRIPIVIEPLAVFSDISRPRRHRPADRRPAGSQRLQPCPRPGGTAPPGPVTPVAETRRRTPLPDNCRRCCSPATARPPGFASRRHHSAVAIETDRQVGGDLTFDRDTGVLRYTPAAADVEEFTLTLRAQGPQGPATLGTLGVVPVAAIPAETRFIDNDRPVPKLPIYNDIRISAGKDQRWFNGVERTTRRHGLRIQCDSIPRTSMQS